MKLTEQFRKLCFIDRKGERSIRCYEIESGKYKPLVSVVRDVYNDFLRQFKDHVYDLYETTETDKEFFLGTASQLPVPDIFGVYNGSIRIDYEVEFIEDLEFELMESRYERVLKRFTKDWVNQIKERKQKFKTKYSLSLQKFNQPKCLADFIQISGVAKSVNRMPIENAPSILSVKIRL